MWVFDKVKDKVTDFNECIYFILNKNFKVFKLFSHIVSVKLVKKLKRVSQTLEFFDV